MGEDYIEVCCGKCKEMNKFDLEKSFQNTSLTCKKCHTKIYWFNCPKCETGYYSLSKAEPCYECEETRKNKKALPKLKTEKVEKNWKYYISTLCPWCNHPIVFAWCKYPVIKCPCCKLYSETQHLLRAAFITFSVLMLFVLFYKSHLMDLVFLKYFGDANGPGIFKFFVIVNMIAVFLILMSKLISLKKYKG